MMTMWLWLAACAGPTADGWEAPEWEGDGLPVDTGGSRSEGIGGGGDTGRGGSGDALSSLHIVDGAFGVLDNPTGVLGYLVLSAEPISCAAAMTYSDYPYGLYILLRGPEEADLTGGWDGEYRWCGEAPCMSDGFWLSSGTSGELPPEAVITLRDGGAHRVTVVWGEVEIVVDNCQDVDAW